MASYLNDFASHFARHLASDGSSLARSEKRTAQLSAHPWSCLRAQENEGAFGSTFGLDQGRGRTLCDAWHFLCI